MMVSALIPALNESQGIGRTVAALRSLPMVDEVIVVDDGSRDGTHRVARAAGARVVRFERNRGKAEAVRVGFHCAKGEVILLLDADLDQAANAAQALLPPVIDQRADLVIGRLLGTPRGAGGFGAVRRLARWAVTREGGASLVAPLSGQRACRRDLLASLPCWGCGFGLEIALTLHGLRTGARIYEVDIETSHRVTGRDLRGFRHRARQFYDISMTLWLLRAPAGDQASIGSVRGP